MKLFLDKQLNTDDKETALLAILNGMYSNKHNHLSTSVSLIGYEMTGRFLKTSNKRERTIIDGIKSGVHSLIEKGIIEVISQYNDNYIFSGKGLEVNSDKKKFVVLEQWEMQRIFENANKPFNVFSFFCSLIGTINNQTKEWHMPQDEMISLWGYGRANGTYYRLNNSYGRYCDRDAIIAEAQKYSDIVECEDFVEKLDRRSIKLRYNAYCNDAKKYRNNFDAEVDLCRQSIAYNKSLKYKPVEGYYDGEYKQGELLDLSVFPDEVRNEVDDNWGDSVPMENDFSIEKILDMPTEGEVQMNPTNIDCVGQNDLCKVVSTPIGVQSETNDYKEPDYIEPENFAPSIRIGEPKVSADKEHNPNNSDSTYIKSHGVEIPRELFCVTGKDSELISIDNMFDESKSVV
ncbi:MAG: hypothetical protein K1W41_27235 [Lachnospiraceae bacterium]